MLSVGLDIHIRPYERDYVRELCAGLVEGRLEASNSGPVPKYAAGT